MRVCDVTYCCDLVSQTTQEDDDGEGRLQIDEGDADAPIVFEAQRSWAGAPEQVAALSERDDVVEEDWHGGSRRQKK